MRCRVQRFTIIGRAAIATLARVTSTAAFLTAAPAMAAEVSMPVKASWQPPVAQVRLDRPLCGRTSRLFRGTFELEYAT